MGRSAVFLIRSEGSKPASADEVCRRLRVEFPDPDAIAELAARIGVLYPRRDFTVTADAIEITVAPTEADELLQALSDLVLRVRISQRDAPLRTRLYARLLG